MSDLEYDNNFQLELNLQQIRRELITFLEFFEDGCLQCNRIKCSCACAQDKLNNTTSTSTMDNSLTNTSVEIKDGGDPTDSKEETKITIEDIQSPPAKALPKPDWEKTSNEIKIVAKTEIVQPKHGAESCLKAQNSEIKNCSKKANANLNCSWPVTKAAYTRRVDMQVSSQVTVRDFFGRFSPTPGSSMQVTSPVVNRTIPRLYQMNLSAFPNFGFY